MVCKICHFYSYKLNEVIGMTYQEALFLFEGAKKIEARKHLDLLRIVSFPHAKKGQGSKISKGYEKDAKLDSTVVVRTWEDNVKRILANGG